MTTYPLSLLDDIKTLQTAYLFLPNGRQVKINSTLRAIKIHGTDCKICGIKGLFFKEREVEDNKSHLRLYTTNKLKWTERNYIGGDHIIPTSKGGANELVNIQPLCYDCNTIKNNKITCDYQLIYEARNIFKNKDILDYINEKYNTSERRELYYGSISLITEDEMKELVDKFNISYEEVIQYAKKVPIGPLNHINDLTTC
jgi:hypothetical protein